MHIHKTKKRLLHRPSGIEAKTGQIVRLAESFKVLGDPTKLRLCMLLAESEKSVAELARLLGLSESAASHSLRVLRSLRLVRYRRAGKQVFYALDDKHVEDLIRVGIGHVQEQRQE